MRKAWPTESLGSRTKFLSGGTPSKSESRFWGGEIPWISSAEMSEERIYTTTHNVSTEGANNGTRLIPKDTVLVVVRGMSLAKECRVSLTTRESTFNQDIKALKLSPDVDPHFIFYYLRSQKLALRDAASEAAHGTKKLDMPVLEQWPLPVVPLVTQHKIAAILTAYDDLIEVNKRRIALLEKIAEELYREWFVRMRFPGHQNTRFVKSLPEEWPFDFGSTFFDHVKGKSYSSNEISDEEGKCFFITLKSFHRRGGYRKEGLKYFSGNYKGDQCVKAGDVVMAVTDMTQDRAVVGEVARIPNLSGKKSVISLDVIRLIPKDISSTFLYAYMRFSGFSNYIKEFANGANVLHLKPDLIGKQRLLFPPKELRDRFSELVEPIFNEAGTLEEANGVLTKTRDLLLPRLISGKLSVDECDIELPPSMQEAMHETASNAENELEASHATVF